MMKIIKGIKFLTVLILIYMAGNMLAENTNGKPSIYLYEKNGNVHHLENLAINWGGSGGCGKNYREACDVLGSPYGGTWQQNNSIHPWKSDIDSIVIEHRNFWTDGLPSQSDIKNGYYIGICDHDTVMIKIIDNSK